MTIPQGVEYPSAFPLPKEGQELYRHKQPFAVVVFSSRKHARAALRVGVEALTTGDEPLFGKECIAEPLNPAWHTLARRRDDLASLMSFTRSPLRNSRNNSRNRAAKGLRSKPAQEPVAEATAGGERTSFESNVSREPDGAGHTVSRTEQTMSEHV